MQHLSEILSNAATQFQTNIALESPGEEPLSYHDVDHKCSQLKSVLSSHGIGEGERVGVFIPKSIESVVSILATLSVNAAYIPVDANGPAERAAYIFKDCQARAILVAPALSQELKALMPSSTLIPLTDSGVELLICQYDQPQILDFPDDLAYMLYTSGSTGRPKGVMITHQNALCFIEWCAEQFQINEDHVFSSIAPFHFDLSIFDIYVPLLKGAHLVLFNEKATKNPMIMAQYLAEKKISVLYATPTMLKLILNYGKCDRHDHSFIQIVLFAGEVFAIPPLRKLKSIWPQATFYNLYGPTETNVVTWFEVPKEIEESQVSPYPIGKACSYANCAIWDDDSIHSTLEVGMKGELIVSGESVAHSYLNLPQANTSSFIHENDTRWYKTGDIVEVNKDGDFSFIGRKDRMVKRNGYRIELGEIEASLLKHPIILEAAVVSYKDAKEEVRIKAFIKNIEGSEKLSTIELKQFCLQYLPMYMLPDKFSVIEEFPKTSTHKIDYQSLKKQSL